MRLLEEKMLELELLLKIAPILITIAQNYLRPQNDPQLNSDISSVQSLSRVRTLL